MTTSLYMPSVVVEMAFGSGYSTAAADRVWTDVSEWVELDDQIAAAIARGDERTEADANSVTLTLDNSDGRFTAGLTSGAYYPDVKIGTPVRVTSTPVGGTDSVRFVGFVDEWPVSWDGTDEYASTTVTASSRFARWGLDAPCASLVRQTILHESPWAYYPLTDAAGAERASEISGRQGLPTLRKVGSGTDVYFGTTTGAVADGGTCAQFFEQKYLRNPDLPSLDFSEVTVEALFATTDAAGYLLRLVDSSSVVVPSGQIEVTMPSAGQILVHLTDGSGHDASFSSVPGYADGHVHHIAASFDVGAGTATLYLDGTAVQTISTAALTGSLMAPNAMLQLGQGFAGTMSHVVVYDRALTADQVATHAQAVLTGFAGESAGDRIARYASWGSAPPDAIDTDAGEATLAAVDTTDKQILDLMREAEVSEGGVLFDAPDGTLTFRSRTRRYVTTPDLTLDFGRQEVGSDFAPRVDRLMMLNDVTVATTDGTTTARSIDAGSRDEYGPSATTIETQAEDPEEPQRHADWTLYAYAEPQPRVSTLTINLLDFDVAPSQNDVLALTVGSLIKCTSQPGQAADSTGYYFVEGYTESIGPESYTLTFNVSPADRWMNVIRFDDPERGLDSGAVLAW